MTPDAAAVALLASGAHLASGAYVAAATLPGHAAAAATAPAAAAAGGAASPALLPAVLAAVLAAAAVALALPSRPDLSRAAAGLAAARVAPEVERPPGFSWPVRALVVALGGSSAAVALGGPVGAVAGLVVAVVGWRVLGRQGTRAERREREQVASALPVLVDLLASALAAGAPVDRAVAAVCAAWPGPAARRLSAAHARLSLGADPVAVWQSVADDPALAPLGRALVRAASSGAPVASAVAALADDLADDARAGVEDHARTVGVRAALPLGLCLLPAFVLLGIVPLAAGLLAGLVA